MARITGPDSRWNYVSFDMTTWRERADSGQAWRAAAARPRRVTIERQWVGDGWRTRVRYPTPPNVTAEAGLVSTVEFDDHGRVTGAWDPLGTAVPMPSLGDSRTTSRSELATTLRRLNVPAATPSPPVALAAAAPPSASGSSRIRPAPAAGAFDFMVVTAAARARNARASTTSSSSVVSDRARGTTGSSMFDPVVGAVVEETRTDRGGTVTHIVRQFEPADGGIHVLRRVTTEVAARDGHAMRVIQEFTNVRVEARDR
ncbi:MAG TPA: hypothetical protein VG916_02150 [Gemmatimonadaceae bacterium]|nr:hypothetical protein [Gemmatimonadaceae bacterium]